MCDFCHAQLFEITHVSNIRSTLVQHSCRNAEVVEAFCRVAAPRSNTRRSIHWPSIAALHTPAEMPTALSFARSADIARRLVLASRLPSRAAPALNPHSARCWTGAQPPATSRLGAFWTPPSRARGSFIVAGVQKPAQKRSFDHLVGTVHYAHSGNPAFRKAPTYLLKSSGRNDGNRFLRSEMRISGSS